MPAAGGKPFFRLSRNSLAACQQQCCQAAREGDGAAGIWPAAPAGVRHAPLGTAASGACAFEYECLAGGCLPCSPNTDCLLLLPSLHRLVAGGRRREEGDCEARQRLGGAGDGR